MRRAQRPLNREAVQAANAALAEQTGGRQLTMQPEDGALRRQWMDAYLAALDRIEGAEDVETTAQDDEGSDYCPAEVIQECVADDAENQTTLSVTVYYTPLSAPIEGAEVALAGPQTLTETTDAAGIAMFENLEPGLYSVSASYRTGNALVEAAQGQIGETTWGYREDRPPYGAGTNKCNLFVFEMANSVGFSVPRRERFSLSQLRTVWYPPLAGEWAGTDSIGSWQQTSSPEPGDTIAQAINYADASGHVGIVGYPEQIESIQAEVVEGQANESHVDLHRRTISAGGTEVLYNDWGYRTNQLGRTVFKRYRP